MLKAAAVASMEVTARATARRGVKCIQGRSSRGLLAAMKRAQKAIWRRASCSNGTGAETAGPEFNGPGTTGPGPAGAERRPLWLGGGAEALASATQWRANARAQPSVSKSPVLMALMLNVKPLLDGVEEGRVNMTIPAKPIPAPAQAFQRGARVAGGRRARTAASKGTSTTTRPVMNADFDAV